MTDNPVHLIVGLGNPGPQYELTRHNVGFLVIDELVDRAGVKLAQRRSAQGAAMQLAEGRLGGPPGDLDARRVVLIKPMVFMNRSGSAVAAAAAFYKVPIERIIVVHDELDLPFGVIRVKRGGGEAGHNGLRSISGSMSSRDYLRVRCGIGRPSGRQSGVDYVLAEFSAKERIDIAGPIDDAANATEALLKHDLATVQNEFHRE
ncbi:MAG TPA: aminoacyl-tRNA hydrolase [Mycobacteriales bacterium]|jgi:PTH1 family peptidyl-tRNA hydrolase|nr:aminoacyl-tRNA hydrolase [Mycobacteriales bacterium]